MTSVSAATGFFRVVGAYVIAPVESVGGLSHGQVMEIDSGSHLPVSPLHVVTLVTDSSFLHL